MQALVRALGHLPANLPSLGPELSEHKGILGRGALYMATVSPSGSEPRMLTTASLTVLCTSARSMLRLPCAAAGPLTAADLAGCNMMDTAPSAGAAAAGAAAVACPGTQDMQSSRAQWPLAWFTLAKRATSRGAWTLSGRLPA